MRVRIGLRKMDSKGMTNNRVMINNKTKNYEQNYKEKIKMALKIVNIIQN